MAKTTLEELVVQLSVENKQFKTAIKASQDQTAKSMKMMEKAVTEFSKDSSQSVSGFQRVMETAAGFIGGQVVLGAFERAKDAAASLFRSLVTDGIAAAQVQEDAIQKLNTQLALSGDFSSSASEDMQAFASQLQKTTKIGDETSLSMLALAKTFGRSNEETKRMVEAAIELSAATGLSLEGSIKNLGKTFAGLTGELGESLPIIRTLTAEQLKAGAATDLILNRFGGTAAAQIKTFSGAVQQASNSWGDYTESIGSIVTQNQSVINVINEAASILSDQKRELDDNNLAFKRLVAEGLIGVINGSAMVVSALQAVQQALEFVTNVGVAGFARLGEAMNFFLSFTDKGKKQMEEFGDIADQATNSLFGRGDDTQSRLDEINSALSRLKGAATEGLKTLGRESQASITPINQAKNAVTELTEEQKKAQEAAFEFANSIADSSSSIQAQIAQDTEILRAQRELQLVTDQEFFAEKLILLEEQHANQLGLLETARREEEITEQQHTEKILALEKRLSLEKEKIRQKEKQSNTVLRRQELGAVSGFFSAMSGLAKTQGREQFETSKKFAKAAAVVDGALAVQKALANPPGFPFNALAVAAAAAKTITQIKTIDAQQFALGGRVPGQGFTDSVPIQATPGEEIIDRRLSDSLRQFFGLSPNSQNNQSTVGGGEMKVTLDFAGGLDGLIEVIETKLIERNRIQTGEGVSF